MRQRVLRRIDSALGTVARHQRREALTHAASLRSALAGRLTLGMERALDDLPDDRDGARWLARAAALLPSTTDQGSPFHDRAPRVSAIICFAPD
jgi:hypothetical protein